MVARCLIFAAIACAALAQQPAAKKWTPPRTPDGKPDLEGIWTNVTLTPLERPASLAGKEFFTKEEAAKYEGETLTRSNTDNPPPPGSVGSYNNFWWDRGTKVVPTRRTSLIVDPPDGRVPALTPEATRFADAHERYALQHPADGPEDRSLPERCILWPTAGPPMLPGVYNNNYQIVQSPGYVMIVVEMIHDVRIIPTGGSPHLPRAIRQWMGDSRGHWEGDTLVVDTTNFTDQTSFRGASRNLHLIEKFTRAAQDQIMYEFTVDDPAAFVKPWSGQIPMLPAKGPLLEYACNEGNYAMEGILKGARQDERKMKE